ncbi:MAG: hypothetical protein AMXMBFR34_47690 [Myxococcaceae bacterium]
MSELRGLRFRAMRVFQLLRDEVEDGLVPPRIPGAVALPVPWLASKLTGVAAPSWSIDSTDFARWVVREAARLDAARRRAREPVRV